MSDEVPASAAATARAGRNSIAPAYPTPAARKLRVFAFDPLASTELNTAAINDAVIELPWETPWEEPLTLGPCNEYLEVVDYDPSSGLFYAPVDLNNPVLLAQDGLPPAEGRPQFHQQMVFAVAMKTIRLFERALGRSVMWAQGRGRLRPDSAFVKRLRIYPHALREANAYYSPDKTALLFGYFRRQGDGVNTESGWVFTCLSQDIIAHETAHAILHGMQRRSIEPYPDTLAFHEAFADIIALFQHFTMTDAVAHQITHARGRLRGQNLLTDLARQFGQATGRRGALRNALDRIDREAEARENGQIAALERLGDVTEPHERGSFLVTAIFDAFITIYEHRTADLLRMATGSSTPDGRELSQDLAKRLAGEAAKAADHILRMCVRALDYVPPIDLRFGEYLRAIITADIDLVPKDALKYRVAFAQAFRDRGIFVPGCMSMAPESLMWDVPDPGENSLLGDDQVSGIFADLLPDIRTTVGFDRPQESAGHEERRINLREESHKIIQSNQGATWEWLNTPSDQDHEWEQLLGVRMTRSDLHSIPLSETMLNRHGIKVPAVEVHSARVARRAGPDGEELHQFIVQISQRRRAYFCPEEQAMADNGTLAESDPTRWATPDFWFRGGATIHVDLRDGRLRRVIRKRIDDEERLARERVFRGGDSGWRRDAGEPFALIHRS